MINQKILKSNIMAELKSGFRGNNPKGVQVQGFMDAESYKKFLAAVTNADFKKSEVRDTHSFFEAKSDTLKWFGSKEFLSFASSVVGKKLAKASSALRIFLAGSYTLMHDEATAEKGIEFCFDLTPQWRQDWGGSTVYLTDAGEKLVLPPAPNNLVINESSRRSYVKYVNNLAGKEGRLVVCGVLQ